MDTGKTFIRITLVVALCGVIAFAVSRRSTLDSDAQGARGGDTSSADGHERMVAALRAIHEKRDQQNAFLGVRPLERARDLLAQSGSKTSPKTIARLHYDIGMNLLRLGHNDEAIESLSTSRTTLEPIPLDEWPPFASKLPYDLAVAWLRLGETSNCVARHTTQSCILPIGPKGVHVDQTGSREAMRWLRVALERSADDDAQRLSARWLLNIAAMTVGEWPDGLSQAELIAPDVFASDVEFPRFVDVARDVGIEGFDLCGGAVTEDLDGDGLVDILSSSWDTDGPLRFYRNRGDGTFEERSSAAGLDGIFGGLNITTADFDGDDDVDLYVLRGAWLSGPGGEVPNSLLRNDGGRFVDVTFEVGLGEIHHPTQAASWADYDLDGDVDLYVGNEASQFKRHPAQLFRNDDGMFTDVAAEAGVTNDLFAKGVSWGDYDGDRFPDLYVSNLNAPNRLYRNRGDGTFEDVGAQVGVQLPMQSFPTWFWDFDNDGNLDIYVSSYDQGEFRSGYRLAPVVASYLGESIDAFGGERPRLYRGDGNGGFVDVAEEVGVDRVTLPMGANFGDLDNDGFLDFYLGTGYPFYDGLIPNVMYWNRGGRSFEDVTTAGGFGHLQKGHGVAFADLDNDGDEDVFEQIGGAYPGDAFGNVLFRNPGCANHWIELRLRGVSSNSFGIGARIRVELDTPDGARVVHRIVSSGGSFGCGSLTQHIGLGNASRIVALEIDWPCTRDTERFTGIALDRHVTITEGHAEVEQREEAAFTLGAADTY